MCAISPLDVSVLACRLCSWALRRRPLRVIQQPAHFTGLDRGNPCLAVADTEGDQQALFGKTGQTGGEFNPLPDEEDNPLSDEEEWPAHAPQPARGVEPDETMLVVASLVPFAHFMDQSKPAAVENDRLGAAAELVGRGRGRGLRDRRRWPRRRAATGVIAARKLRASLS